MKAILTYHSIDASGSVISVDPGRFRRQMAWLAGTGVAVVGLDQLLQDRDDTGDKVAITFDDAFANFATDAWPVLRERGWAATLFVPTARAGETNVWERGGRWRIPEMPLLDWDALGRLADDGVTLGSHTRTHADLRRAGVGDLAAEVEGSAQDLVERTGRRPRWFAYPYGGSNETVVDAARRVYDGAVTTVLAAVPRDADPHRVPRIDAYYLRGIENLESWSWRRLLLYLGVRRALRRVRGMLTNA